MKTQSSTIKIEFANNGALFDWGDGNKEVVVSSPGDQLVYKRITDEFFDLLDGDNIDTSNKIEITITVK